MSNTTPTTAPVAPAVLQPYAMSFPAAAPANAHWVDRVVKQGHVDYCELMGHATHTIDGVDQGYCPRCGESTAESTPAPDYYRHSVDCARHAGNVPCTKDCDRRRAEWNEGAKRPMQDCGHCGEIFETGSAAEIDAHFDVCKRAPEDRVTYPATTPVGDAVIARWEDELLTTPASDSHATVPVADVARLVTTCTNCGRDHECYLDGNDFRYVCGSYDWPVADRNVRPETAKAGV